MIKGIWAPYAPRETMAGRVMYPTGATVDVDCQQCWVSIDAGSPGVLLYGQGFFHKDCFKERFDVNPDDIEDAG